jgi:predicted dehydrogenase
MPKKRKTPKVSGHNSMPAQYWSSLARLGFYRPTWATDVGQSMSESNVTIPYAMIGCGLQATTVIKPNAQRAGFRLTATCDIDRSKAERATLGHSDVRVYTDYEQLLNEATADVIFVTGPPTLHFSAGIAALNSGRHLFVEKPPAWSSGDVRRMRDVAVRSRKKVMVGLNKRHALLYQHAKQLVNTSPYGPPRVFRMNLSHWPVPDLRDHLFFFSIHAIDLCLYFMGPIRQISISRTEFGEARSLGLFAEHDNGSISQLSLNSTYPGLHEHLEVSSDESLVSVDDLTSIEWAQGEDMSASVWSPHTNVPGPSSDSSVLQGYSGEMAHFHDALISDHQPDGGLDAALSAIQILELICGSPEGLSHHRVGHAPSH